MLRIGNGVRVGAATLALAAAVLMSSSGLRGQSREGPPPGRRARTVDIEEAENFDQFRDAILKRTDKMTDGIAKMYELGDEQKGEAREIVDRHVKEYLANQGPKLFDLFKRGKALGEFMKEERIGWEELPRDLKQQLLDQAIPLMEDVQKRLRRFSDDFAATLDEKQLEKLSEERRKMESNFAMGLAAARAIRAGKDPPEPTGPDGHPRPRRRPRRPRGDKGRVDRWERYVKMFIERHKLDEIQKLQAESMLEKWKGKLRELRARQADVSASVATSQPTTRPAETEEDFRKRLEGVRERTGGGEELFERLKKDLDRIPTPVQKQLAEDSRRKAEPNRGPGKP